MRSKEEYYASVKKNRELASDAEVTKCTCPNTLCDWHGKCKECVALHRYHNDHIPVCLQPILEDKVTALVNTIEMVAAKKEGTPLAYRNYVKEMDKQSELHD
ncbi:hypothetical protein AGMMS49992_03310 [Clostridia bacterium]|nr:hypothetical protein AGMMS49992_03310 [Clostridia bacterium]